MRRLLLAFLSPIVALALAFACGENTPSSPSSAVAGATAAAGSTGRSQNDPSLGAPTTQEPPVGEAVLDLQPELVIGNATGGAGTRTYMFDLALDSAFQQIVLTESGVTEGLGGITRWRVTDPLEADTKYYWRVQAATSAGPGPYSAVSEFRVREPFSADRQNGSLVVFDPLTNGSSVGEVMGGSFVEGGWQPQTNVDCLRYQVPTLEEGRIEFVTTNLSTPNPVEGKRILISMWDPTKGDYRENPFRVHIQKLDLSTAKFDDVRLRWISRGEEHNTGISFYDFEPQLVYEWRMEWGTFPGYRDQHVKIFLEGIEILNRNYSAVYHPKTHWIELGQCERQETLELAIYSNIRIGSR
ncbi:MAG: hypothetical protein ACRD21_09480 [Vicinamibacteria bacterium]